MPCTARVADLLVTVAGSGVSGLDAPSLGSRCVSLEGSPKARCGAEPGDLRLSNLHVHEQSDIAVSEAQTCSMRFGGRTLADGPHRGDERRGDDHISQGTGEG